MHILSIFPDLLTFGLVAPTLLRITVGIIGILAGWSIFKQSETVERKSISLPYFITGIFLIIGMYTQPFAIIGVILVYLKNFVNKKNNSAQESCLMQVLISIVLISLLFTGPGFMAIDYPL